MQLNHLKYFIFLILGVISLNSHAQTIESICLKPMSSDYILQDKDQRTKVKPNQTVTYHVTFYKDYTYRLSACSNFYDATLLVELIDFDGNTLYSNEFFEFSPYWDFKFQSTVECLVRIRIVENSFKDATINLIIGYKKI